MIQLQQLFASRTASLSFLASHISPTPHSASLKNDGSNWWKAVQFYLVITTLWFGQRSCVAAGGCITLVPNWWRTNTKEWWPLIERRQSDRDFSYYRVTAFLEPVTDRPGIIHNREEEQWQNQHLLNPKRHIYFGMPPDEELLAMVKERHDHPYTSCLPNDDSESNEEDDSDSDDEDTLFESWTLGVLPPRVLTTTSSGEQCHGVW